MSFDLEQIRSRNPIEAIVGEKFALKSPAHALLVWSMTVLWSCPILDFISGIHRANTAMCLILSDGMCLSSGCMEQP